MKTETIITQIAESLETVTLGQLPYCDSDAEKIAMFCAQEAELARIVTVALALAGTLASERESYEACAPMGDCNG
jgi:hypothetical protein